MGCNTSITNDVISRITNEQLNEITHETISPLSFRFFLYNFYFVSRYSKFYTELPLEKQALIFENISPLDKEECTTVIENFCQYSQDEANLFINLRQLTLKMICKTYDKTNGIDVYLPIGLDKKLWKSIIQKKFKTGFGEYKITKKMIDWTNPDLIKERQHFINENIQYQNYKYPHSKDLSLLIQNNTIDNLWKKKNIKIENRSIQNKVSKPFFWEMDIHQAAFKGKKSSVEYNLFLIPQMLNLPDYEGNTLVHHAAKGNQKKILIYLHNIGADFDTYNSDGFLPIHLISKKSIIKTMTDFGISIDVRNGNDETLLDIKTKNFDEEMIKTLIGLGSNIFETNKNRSFWIQTTIHNKYFGSFTEEKFIKFVRKLLIKNKTASWNDNPIYNEIINRKKNKDDQLNIDDLRDSVKKKDIDRINVLLAIGTKADEIYQDEGTNIYYCAKNGFTDVAQILGNNYCDPNFTNSRHENTFWAAAINEHFDTALVLRNCGANVNMLDSLGETLLHNVYRRKIDNIFNFVLDAGGSPNVKNAQGEIVTFIAFKTKDDVIAEMIQDRYSDDINVQDKNMNSLVHLAYKNNDFERIDYLSQRRINMDLKDKNCHSVLMISFLSGINFKVLDFLIKCGSNVSTRDKDNNTILHHLLFQSNPPEDVYKFSNIIFICFFVAIEYSTNGNSR